MRRLIATMRRALALYRLRCLEIELHDRTEALRNVPADELTTLCRSRRRIQRELLAARQNYISLLEPGYFPTWRVA